MPHPQGKQSILRQKLVDYLVQECDRFFPNMDWEYYAVDMGETEEPKGAVLIDRIIRDNNYPANVAHVPKTYNVHLSLKLFHEDYKVALDRAADWEEEISDRIIKKLQIEGYEALFKGIFPNPRQPSIIQENKNQDGGGYINLHLFYVWDDDGKIESSLDIPDYLLDN